MNIRIFELSSRSHPHINSFSFVQHYDVKITIVIKTRTNIRASLLNVFLLHYLIFILLLNYSLSEILTCIKTEEK